MAAQPEYGTTILERCQVAPPPLNVAAQSLILPLTHFDMAYLPFFTTNYIFFYNHPCSRSHFLENIVPNLKNSLAITLKHFSPLAGKVVFPDINSVEQFPVGVYEVGDSILLTIVEISNVEFAEFMGDHAREASRFHDFVPDELLNKMLTIQISFFPNQGFCIGFTTDHVIADGTAFFRFILAWAMVSKLKGDDSHLLRKEHLTFYDRSNTLDPNGLDSIVWSHMKNLTPLLPKKESSPTPLKCKFRKTCVFKKSDINDLKKYVCDHTSGLEHVSSFTVTCALVWFCLSKSTYVVEDKIIPDDETEYFNCIADCRSRLNPPLPVTYFGNCTVPVFAELPHGKLNGNDGFLAAVEAIGNAIRKTVYNEKGILHDAEYLFEKIVERIGKRMVAVAGSPRFNVYGADFGWGEPKKFECLHIDHDEAIFIVESREFKGGLEISLSKPKVQMDVIESIFNKSLREYSQA